MAEILRKKWWSLWLEIISIFKKVVAIAEILLKRRNFGNELLGLIIRLAWT